MPSAVPGRILLTRFRCPCGRTVWEIKQRTIVDMAADRGAFIDQSQSLNIHLENPNFGKLTSLHFYTWRKVSAAPRPPAHAPAALAAPPAGVPKE